jgi:glycosyltransferase involved in cell wall biosynthesis
MRILFLTHYFPPEGNAPAARVYQMARRWSLAGHEVEVITGVPNVPTGKVYAGYRNRLHQIEHMDGLLVRRIWTFLAPNKGILRRSLNYISYLVSAAIAGLCVRRPDVLIATSPQFLCGCAGALLSKCRRLPFVLEIRDLWPESIVAVGALRKNIVLRVLERIERWMYGRASRIVTVGEGYRNRLVERGVSSERIAVIPNAPDWKLFFPRPPDENIRKEYNLENRFICAYVGTIGMASGLQVVLRAARLLKQDQRNDVVFLLVGDGAIYPDLLLEAKNSGLDNVRFTGLQPKVRIPAFLATADACLVHLKRQPPFRSVLPSKMLEAAAMAKPVILGVEGFAADLLTRMNGGLCIEPENERALITAVDRLRQNPEAARKMGESAYRYVREHFDLDRLAALYESVLREVAGT